MEANEKILELIRDGLDGVEDIKALARKADCSYAYLYQLRAGEKRKVSVHIADKLLSVLGLSAEIGATRKEGRFLYSADSLEEFRKTRRINKRRRYY